MLPCKSSTETPENQPGKVSKTEKVSKISQEPPTQPAKSPKPGTPTKRTPKALMGSVVRLKQLAVVGTRAASRRTRRTRARRPVRARARSASGGAPVQVSRAVLTATSHQGLILCLKDATRRPIRGLANVTHGSQTRDSASMAQRSRGPNRAASKRRGRLRNWTPRAPWAGEGSVERPSRRTAIAHGLLKATRQARNAIGRRQTQRRGSTSGAQSGTTKIAEILSQAAATASHEHQGSTSLVSNAEHCRRINAITAARRRRDNHGAPRPPWVSTANIQRRRGTTCRRRGSKTLLVAEHLNVAVFLNVGGTRRRREAAANHRSRGSRSLTAAEDLGNRGGPSRAVAAASNQVLNVADNSSRRAPRGQRGGGSHVLSEEVLDSGAALFKLTDAAEAGSAGHGCRT